MYAQVREEFGRVDVLFKTPAFPRRRHVGVETSLEAWQRVQDVNLKSVFLCCSTDPVPVEGGTGSVIKPPSFVAVIGAATSQISYTTSRAACCR